MTCRIFTSNAGILLMGPLGTNYEILIEIHTRNAFENVVCEMMAILPRLQCVKKSSVTTVWTPVPLAGQPVSLPHFDTLAGLRANTWNPRVSNMKRNSSGDKRNLIANVPQTRKLWNIHRQTVKHSAFINNFLCNAVMTLGHIYQHKWFLIRKSIRYGLISKSI